MSNIVGSVGFDDPNQALEGKFLTVGGIQGGIVELSTLITTPSLKRNDSDQMLNITLHKVRQKFMKITSCKKIFKKIMCNGATLLVLTSGILS